MEFTESYLERREESWARGRHPMSAVVINMVIRFLMPKTPSPEPIVLIITKLSMSHQRQKQQTHRYKMQYSAQHITCITDCDFPGR